MTTMKVLQRKENSKGVTYSIQIEEGPFVNAERPYGVWKLCINYVRGKDVRVWRYIERNMDADAALALFNRRSK